MIKFNLLSKFLLGIFVTGLCLANLSAAERDKEDTSSKSTASTQATTPSSEDKVEPLGLESGPIVDKPANLADKIGDKINELLGNNDDK